MTEDLVRFIEVNEIKPIVDREFDFCDALAAYQHLEAGRAVGKVVINIH
jgi:NADPH:quinone reductase-like Zn-dependent oxidoreductase